MIHFNTNTSSAKISDEAHQMIIDVPRIFLKRVFKCVVDAAKEGGSSVITAEFMKRNRGKRIAVKGD
jgi:hypothetical protein